MQGGEAVIGAALDVADLRRIYTGPAKGWPAPVLDPGVIHAELAALTIPARPEPDSPEARLASLGERLFRDPILSASGHFSCESCHNRSLGWGDGLPRAFGHGRAEGRRNAPGLFSAGFRKTLFWDSRAATLEVQALAPLVDPAEMANPDLESVIARLSRDGSYPGLFRAVFGGDTADAVTAQRLGQALAAFQRGLERVTKLDRFLSGDADALDDAQLRGMHLFRTRARCLNCHGGPLLTDEGHHNLGLGFPGGPFEDAGRYGVTGDPADAAAFRTPSLRHVSRTGPWMHNGLFPTLEGIVNFYNGGGGKPPARGIAAGDDPVAQSFRRVSPHLRPLDLTRQQIADLTAFLGAL